MQLSNKPDTAYEMCNLIAKDCAGFDSSLDQHFRQNNADRTINSKIKNEYNISPQHPDTNPHRDITDVGNELSRQINNHIRGSRNNTDTYWASSPQRPTPSPFWKIPESFQTAQYFTPTDSGEFQKTF